MSNIIIYVILISILTAIGLNTIPGYVASANATAAEQELVDTMSEGQLYKGTSGGTFKGLTTERLGLKFVATIADGTDYPKGSTTKVDTTGAITIDTVVIPALKELVIGATNATATTAVTNAEYIKAFESVEGVFVKINQKPGNRNRAVIQVISINPVSDVLLMNKIEKKFQTGSERGQIVNIVNGTDLFDGTFNLEIK